MRVCDLDIVKFCISKGILVAILRRNLQHVSRNQTPTYGSSPVVLVQRQAIASPSQIK